MLFCSETAFDVLNVDSAVAINVQLLKCLRCNGLSFSVQGSGKEFQEFSVVCVKIVEDGILFCVIICYPIVAKDLGKFVKFNEAFLVSI